VTTTTPDSLPTLAVTGSTGVLGGMVARALAADGVPQRLLARSVERAPQLAGSIALPSSYSDRAASERALDGVQTLATASTSTSCPRWSAQTVSSADQPVPAGWPPSPAPTWPAPL